MAMPWEASWGTSAQNTAWKPLSKRLAHAKYGNRSNAGQGLRLASWNPGSAYLHNRTNEIEALISTHKPHLLVISEARFYHKNNDMCVQIPHYDLIQSKTLENEDFMYSRIHIYKHESITAKVRNDLMDSSVSSIWLSVGLKHQRKILVGGVYRVWQHLDRRDGGASGTDSAQLGRWNTFLNQWERALEENKEVITIGDFNPDWPGCMEQEPTPGSKAYRTRKMAEQLAVKILSRGVTQLVRGATRSWPGQSDSCLDLIFTNKPEKTSEVKLTTTDSDHKLVQVTCFAKGLKTTPRYTTKR